MEDITAPAAPTVLAITPLEVGRSERAGLGDLLRRWRLRVGLSQAALAERASLSAAAIAALEQGQRRKPHPHTLRQLAVALALEATEEAALLEAVSTLASRDAPPPPSWSGPSPSTELIGREIELGAMANLLVARPAARLVTITGPGGVGKTRLALAVAAALQPHFADGAVFVDLSALRDPRLVENTIAHAFHIRNSAVANARNALFEVLRTKHVLLVLDNFEQLTGAATALAALADACPGMTLLITSRTALHLRAEQRYPLAPLDLPAASETEIAAIAKSPAIRLFTDRARAISPGFALTADNAAAVVAICRRLDGLPLAIELAAARIVELPPRALLARLDCRLSVLTTGSDDLPSRQQTLRATLEWSYVLLPPAEQALFRQLAVFAGGWTLRAVEAVCRVHGDVLSADAILRLQTSLVDRSLVRLSGQVADAPHFDMLETLREYGLEVLAASGEEPVVRRRLADYYTDLAEMGERGLHGVDQAHWVAVLGSEQDNMRAVLTWALEAGELDCGLRIIGAIWQLWWMRGLLREGRGWLDDLLSAPQAATASLTIRAKALNAAGGLALGMGDYAAARQHYEQSVATATAVNDRDRQAIVLHNLAYLAVEEGDTERAVACVEASLTQARAAGDMDLVAAGLCTLGGAVRQQGDLDRASALLEQSLAMLRQLGDRLWEESALRHLAQVARDRHDWSAAESRYKEALRVSRALGDGYVLGFARSFEGLAEVALHNDRATHAAWLLGVAAQLREEIGSPMTPVTLALVHRVRDGARARLGEAPFQDAFRAGATLERTDTVDLALSTPCAEPAPPAVASDQQPSEQVHSASLAPPPAPAHLISRQRLLDRLDGALDYGLTLLAAPAGSGKTSLLVDWAGRVGSRVVVAWLSLDRGDDDPVRFWHNVLAALNTQRGGVVARAQAALRGGAQETDLVVDALVADFGELDTDLVLILDDYHLIQSAAIHATLGALLLQVPPRFHLVLSSRHDPPLALARRRAAGQLVELRAADLRFSEAEAAALLGAVTDLDLSTQQIATLSARAEGWAAGLQLAALSLRSRNDLDAAIASFVGSERFVVDYFVEEVLTGLPATTQSFLERTSILDRLTGSLCDAVVGESGGTATLENLERANAFVTLADNQHIWYRYHQLFAGALRHRLQRDAPELVLELHGRAAEWYANAGLAYEAVEHELAGQHWDRAADRIGSLIVPLISRGEHLTLQRWLTNVPHELAQRHPVLSGYRAASLMLAGEFAALDTFLAGAEPALERAGHDQALGRVLSIHAERAAMHDDATLALACAGRALSLLPPGPSGYRTTAMAAVTRSHLLHGDLGQAERVLEQAVEATDSTVDAAARWELGNLGAYCCLLEGKLHRAAARYEAVLQDVGERAVFARQAALLGLSVLAYESNRLDQADAHLNHVIALRKQAGRRNIELPFAALLRGRVLRAQGQLMPAEETLDRAGQAAREVSSTRLQRLVRAERAWVALLDGRLAQAARWAEEVDAMRLEQFAGEPEALMLARVRRAQGRAADMVPLLERMLATARTTQRGHGVIAILVQLALAREDALDRVGSLAALEEAVTRAEPDGYVRTFVDEGEAMLPLLRRLLKGGVGPAYLAGVLHGFGAGRDLAPTGAELLTAREWDVLRLLAIGMSNRAIAEHLVTGEATIKSHVHRLIGKFGVSSRAQALMRAHHLGLIG